LPVEDLLGEPRRAVGGGIAGGPTGSPRQSRRPISDEARSTTGGSGRGKGNDHPAETQVGVGREREANSSHDTVRFFAVGPPKSVWHKSPGWIALIHLRRVGRVSPPPPAAFTFGFIRPVRSPRRTCRIASRGFRQQPPRVSGSGDHARPATWRLASANSRCSKPRLRHEFEPSAQGLRQRSFPEVSEPRW